MVTVSVRAVKKNLIHRESYFVSEYTTKNDIKQVRIDSRIVWNDGEKISSVTSAVFATRHPYIGDMPKNGQTAGALQMAYHFGNYTNELQTTEEPYGWKFILEDDIELFEQEEKEIDMKSSAYILLAVIDNLGEVSYEYTVDGKPFTLSVSLEEASTFAGANIKEIGQDISRLQRLIQRTGSEFLNSIEESFETDSFIFWPDDVT